MFANIVVVLVSVKHDDSIGQGKAGIAIGKWGVITILKKPNTLVSFPSLGQLKAKCYRIYLSENSRRFWEL